jgi:hypothetical protein
MQIVNRATYWEGKEPLYNHQKEILREMPILVDGIRTEMQTPIHCSYSSLKEIPRHREGPLSVF